MNVICLDSEMEYEDLTNNLQGCFIDLMVTAPDYKARLFRKAGGS